MVQNIQRGTHLHLSFIKLEIGCFGIFGFPVQKLDFTWKFWLYTNLLSILKIFVQNKFLEKKSKF